MQHAELKILSGPLAGKSIVFDSYTICLGRGSESSFNLSGYKEISRMHAVIRWDGTGWLLEDQDSSNGSEVDGQRVTLVRLKQGSKIQLGDFEAQFNYSSDNYQITKKSRWNGFLLNSKNKGVLAASSILVLVVTGSLFYSFTHRHPLSTKPHPKSPKQISTVTSQPAVPTIPIPMQNEQALILQHDKNGNWFEVGAGTVLNTTTVAVPSNEVLNTKNQIVDVKVVLGSSIPYIRWDIPPGSIVQHGDYSLITLPESVTFPLTPTLDNFYGNIRDQEIAIEILSNNYKSRYLLNKKVIASLIQDPNSKIIQYCGLELNYHNNLQYGGAPVFQDGKLLGMMVGTQKSSLYQKTVAYGFYLAYLNR